MSEGDPSAFEEDVPDTPGEASETDDVTLPTPEEIEAQITGVEASQEAEQKAKSRQPAKDPAIEERARKLGWKSPEEWRGDPPPGGHKSAAEFLETNAALRRELDLVRAESVEATRRSIEVAQAAMQRQLARERDEIEAYYAAERSAAIQAGDVKAVDALDAAKSKELAALQPQQNEAWIAEAEARNADIIQNPLTAGAFQGVFRDLSRRVQAGEYPQLKTRKDIAEAAFWVVRQRMGGGQQPKPAAQAEQPPRAVGVDAGGRAASGATSKGYNGLPDEAKTAFKMLSKSGAYSDDPKGRAEYAKDYWSQ